MINALFCYTARGSRADQDVILPACATASTAAPAWLIGSFNRYRPELPVLTPAIRSDYLSSRLPEMVPRAFQSS